ncbi:MAG: hypothetical protein HWN66_20040 [Candidatus Helarchaeota archaeon]|nr:hypothetical protein [Candidatus Helarchaeota archaeon]
MAHTAQEPVEIQLALQFGSANIASRFAQFKEKGVMRRILFILLLNPEENPKNFFDMLVDFEKDLKLEIDATYLAERVKNTFIKKTSSQISAIFNTEELSSKIIKRSKQLLDSGEIQKAQSLISKAKNIPSKIAETLQLAENALNEKDFTTAGTHYEAVSKLLFEVDETALMQQYHEKAEKVKKIPVLQKERKEFAENAQKALKKVDFSTAIEWYNAAAKNSEELGDKIKATEYSKKAAALENFLEADREAKLNGTSKNKN